MNQSIALAKAGMEVYHAGAVGTDGLFLLDQMEKERVHTEHIMVLEEARTGNAIIQNDRDGDNCIILYGGANQKITTEQVDKVISCFQEGDYLLLQNEVNQLPLELVDCFILNEIEAFQLLGTEDGRMADGEEMAALLHQKYPSGQVEERGHGYGGKSFCNCSDKTWSVIFHSGDG